ncbi:MAG: 50S ribosomal protein L10 [Thermoleophilia bacterium]|nr:50S ribosomal protein L10 [Thermoleophilia bacterium]
MLKSEKVAVVDAIIDRMKSAETYYLVDFRGLSVAEATDLRGRLRADGATLMVVKNTLAKRAAGDAGLEGLEALLQGPTAIAFCGDDPVAPAKTLQGFIKEKKKLAIKGGYLQNRVIEAARVEQMASLPSREELIARIVGGIATPLYGLANVLTGPMRGLVVALDQIREQKAQAA